MKVALVWSNHRWLLLLLAAAVVALAGGASRAADVRPHEPTTVTARLTAHAGTEMLSATTSAEMADLLTPVVAESTMAGRY